MPPGGLRPSRVPQFVLFTVGLPPLPPPPPLCPCWPSITALCWCSCSCTALPSSEISIQALMEPRLWLFSCQLATCLQPAWPANAGQRRPAAQRQLLFPEYRSACRSPRHAVQHDDAVDGEAHRLVKSVTAGRAANGCPLTATMFISSRFHDERTGAAGCN